MAAKSSTHLIEMNTTKEAVFRDHIARFRRDPRNIMTMVFTTAHYTMPTRVTEEDPVVVMDPASNRLIHFDNDPVSQNVLLTSDSFENAESVQIRYDLLDCYVDICAPSVLQLLHAEFDFADLRKDLIVKSLTKSVLPELQNSIYLHVADQYAVRVRDFPAYAAVSMDILHRWYWTDPSGSSVLCALCIVLHSCLLPHSLLSPLPALSLQVFSLRFGHQLEWTHHLPLPSQLALLRKGHHPLQVV